MLTAVILTLLAAFGLACTGDESDDDEDSMSLNDWIERGKHFLMENEGEYAAAAFESALRIDADSKEAQYGLVLSGPLTFANFVDQIIGTLASITFNPEDDPTRDVGQAFSVDQVENSIHTYLLETIVDYITRSEDGYGTLTDDSIADFELERFPIKINNADLMLFGGTFDDTDLRFFGAVNGLVDALFDFILAHNLSFDFTVLAIPELEDASTLETIDTVVQIIEDLLTSETHPNFLKLEPEYGPHFMSESGIAFGNAFTRCAETFDSLIAESGNQDDHQIRFMDYNFDGLYQRWDEPAVIGKSFTLQPTIAYTVHSLCAELGPIFYEGSEMDADPMTVSLFTPATLNELLIALSVLPIDIGPFTIETLPDWGGINIGKFFQEPASDGIQSILLVLVDLWNLIAPLLIDEAA
jgi:hypothetical protein